MKDKNIVVTGGMGLIGRELVEQLQALGANVKVVDFKNGYDLRRSDVCREICRNADYVFHLAGVKGSARMTKERPVDYMAPMLQFDTNMIVAALEAKVERFLYTSSIAVLNPKTDFYPAWAKQTGETLIEAIRQQYPDGTKYAIVRPGSVYGRYENWNREGLMVISDMIKRALSAKRLASAYPDSGIVPSLELWDDGEGIRDFINAKDVAAAMILVMDKIPQEWVAIGNTGGWKIKYAAEIVAKACGVVLHYGPNKSTGDNRTMDTSLLTKLGFSPRVGLTEGIQEAVEYARKEIA